MSARLQHGEGWSISGSTRLLAVMGHPVGHSLSPRMHNASFMAEGLDYAYVALDVDPRDLPAAVKGACVMGFRGFNLTMPHKRAIIPLLDEIDEAAAVSGAVNTVVIEDSGRLRGHNTDGGGFTEACREAGIPLAGGRVLLLGAGGAAAAIAIAMMGEGIGELYIVNRNVGHAEQLARKLREVGGETRVNVHGLDDLDVAARRAEIMVNATPLGMKEGDALPVPVEYLDGRAVCDAVYLPGRETALIQASRERGARVVAGKRMLLYQGVEAQRLWTGLEPNVKAMSDAISP